MRQRCKMTSKSLPNMLLLSFPKSLYSYNCAKAATLWRYVAHSPFKTHTDEKSSCRSFISGAVGCPFLAVPCLGSIFLHCGLWVIINLLGLSRSPAVIWDSWVSIGKGHDKATQWWRRSGESENRLTDEIHLENWTTFLTRGVDHGLHTSSLCANI